MSTETSIRTVIRRTPGGRFIATAIDYPGVITFADTEEEVKKQLLDAYVTMGAWRRKQSDIKLEKDLLKYSDGGITVTDISLNIVNA